MFQFWSCLAFIKASRWRWITYTCIAILSSIFEASYPVTTSDVFLWEASNKCTFCTTRIGESFHWRGILWSISREKDGTLLWRRTVRNESVRRGDALTGVWHRDNWTVPPHLDIRWSGHALLWYNRWSTSCKYVWVFRITVLNVTFLAFNYLHGTEAGSTGMYHVIKIVCTSTEFKIYYRIYECILLDRNMI
jgi:hypothetical protein